MLVIYTLCNGDPILTGNLGSLWCVHEAIMKAKGLFKIIRCKSVGSLCFTILANATGDVLKIAAKRSFIKENIGRI